MMDLLNKLTQCWGPSGREDKIRSFIASEAKQYADEMYTDALGNLIVHKKGNGKKLMFAAHMDEIGIAVTFIDEKGFLRFAPVGGLDIKYLPARKVVFENGTIGVIGQEEAFDKEKKASVAKLYIDIGADSAETAEKHVSIGDSAVFIGEIHETDTRVISKALDNRVGCYILLEAMKRQTNAANDVYYVFTVQEEVGLRGARTAGYGVDADIAVNIDVTDTGDTPKSPVMAVKLGGGAAVKVMDASIICDAQVRTAIIETAKQKNLLYQLEVMTEGGTDAGQIHLSRAGVKTGGISVPNRYMHSPSEMVDKDDIEACIALTTALTEYQW